MVSGSPPVASSYPLPRRSASGWCGRRCRCLQLQLLCLLLQASQLDALSIKIRTTNGLLNTKFQNWKIRRGGASERMRGE